MNEALVQLLQLLDSNPCPAKALDSLVRLPRIMRVTNKERFVMANIDRFQIRDAG